MSKLKHRETSLATNCLCLLFSCKSFFFFFCIKYSAFKVIKNFRLRLWPDLAASLIIFFANAALATELQCRRTKFKPWVRKIPWRRKWQPTAGFLPGKSHGQGSLGGYSPWDCQGSDMTDQLTLSLFSHRTSPENPQCCRLYESIPWKWMVAPIPKLGTSFCLIRQQQMKQFFVVLCWH